MAAYISIIEQSLVPKLSEDKCEDGIVVTDDFVAVIDGSTSKSQYRHSLWRSNGRYAMQLIARYIKRMPKTTTCQQFMTGVTATIASHYKRSMIPQLTQHPEDRMTASVVVFSRVCREVWMIGDCQCLVGDNYFDNPKPFEAELAAMRAKEVERLLAQGATVSDLLRHDTARPLIIPRMLQTMQQQNNGYSVVDGFPIDRQHVRIIPLDFRPWQIVLATDGYPFLCPTLPESEARLQQQRMEDPLNIGPRFQATKAFHPDQASFDDRAYIRFSV